MNPALLIYSDRCGMHLTEYKCTRY